MIQISLRGELGKGRFALIDDEDFNKVKNFKWWMSAKGYAVTWLSKNPHKRGYMHRMIINTPMGMSTDHINHDKLDNRKENLRACTHQQNMGNKLKRTNSRFKGVYYYPIKRIKKYAARIGKGTFGFFLTAEEAALAYNEKAKTRWGKFAVLNPIDPSVKITKFDGRKNLDRLSLGLEKK